MSVAQIASAEKLRAGPFQGGGRNVWALGDQVVISGSNFTTMVLCARGMTPAEFGAFSLVYSALLLVNTLQSSLINQPHNVIGSTRRGIDYMRYTSATALAQLLVTGIAAGLATCVGVISLHAGWKMSPLLLALAPAVLAWQLQEFARRVMYTEGRFLAAFSNDLICYGGQTVILVMLFRNDAISGPRALLAIAAASGVAAVVGAWRLRASLAARPDLHALKENWHFGKWLAGADLLNWCSSIYMYQYVAAVVLGTAATGVLKAAQTVFGPARVMAFFLATVLPIRFARTFSEQGSDAMHRQMTRIYALLLPALVTYCALVAIGSRWILHVLYGAKYSGYAPVLSLYAVYSLFGYIEMGLTAAISARRKTRYIFAGYIYGGMISVSVGWLLIRWLGVNGAVVGMMLTTLLVSARLLTAYRHELRQHREVVPEPINVEACT